MPDAETAAVEVDALQKTYRDGLLGRRRIEALKGVSFRVAPGTIFGLLGPNGAGKTTLIKVLLGIVRKSGGRATLLGRPAGDRSGRRSVGYLPESHRIPRHHTGNSALAYYGGLSGLSGRDIRRRRPELLQLVGLAEWGKTPVKKYSKGMLQRLGLAQAMLHNPELLILDEPTDGVDPVGRSQMRAVLQRLKDEGKTIFINSHLLQEVELVCDRVAILVGGRLRREGLISEITRRAEMEVELTLAGDEQAIRGALRECQIASWRAPGSGPKPAQSSAGGQPEQFQATLKLHNQSAVDACVDALRSAGVSLIELTHRRDTLEEAFMEIVTSDWASDGAEPVFDVGDDPRRTAGRGGMVQGRA
ncbi:MAG: ABC transporter ATP-binding protein [Planctomycetaceae bacterium]